MPIVCKPITDTFLAEFLTYAEYVPESFNFRWTRHVNAKVPVGSLCGTLGTGGYTYITLKGYKVVLHRLLWTYLYGQIPDGLVIDHIDCNRSNNNPQNLRLVTVGENLQNRRTSLPSAKSGLLGVTPCCRSKSWIAQIKINGKQTHIGQYRTKEEAFDAYVAMKRKHHPKSTL